MTVFYSNDDLKDSILARQCLLHLKAKGYAQYDADAYGWTVHTLELMHDLLMHSGLPTTSLKERGDDLEKKDGHEKRWLLENFKEGFKKEQ